MNELQKINKAQQKLKAYQLIVDAVGYSYMFLSILAIGLKFTVLQAVSWWIILLPTFLGLGFLFICVILAIVFLIIENKVDNINNNKKGEI